MSQIVYIPQDIEEEGKKYLIERGYKLKIGKSIDEATLIKEVKDCDAILTRSNAMINRNVIEAAKKVKIISKYGVGIDNIDVRAATEKGIYVTNTPEANANTVAEYVLAVMLVLSKKLMEMDSALRRGNYAIRSHVFSEELKGKVLGIIGIGRIGKLVAKKAAEGLDMKIIAYDPYVQNTDPHVTQVDTMEEVLQKADVISLHLPLTRETRGIIGKKEFQQMKRSAYFINAARGGVVNEQALIEILKEKRIAGAGIDVFELEPPDENNELFKLENCIVTPHSAALSVEGATLMSLHAAIQVDQVLRGEKPNWPVNDINNVYGGVNHYTENK